jgi:hypothetical protein
MVFVYNGCFGAKHAKDLDIETLKIKLQELTVAVSHNTTRINEIAKNKNTKQNSNGNNKGDKPKLNKDKPTVNQHMQQLGHYTSTSNH